MATMARLSDRLKGIIGDRTADALAAVFGMSTVEDLLRHYPRRYVVRGEFSDISSLIEGDEVTVLAVLFIILESSEKKSIEFCKGCVFNLEGNINMNCV